MGIIFCHRMVLTQLKNDSKNLWSIAENLSAQNVIVLDMCEWFDESDIIRNILIYPEFNNFYNIEWIPRTRCGTTVVWKTNSSCPQYAIQDIDIETGNPSIQLKSLPHTFDDAFLVAHELEHVIKLLDGQYLNIMINTNNERCYIPNAIKDLAFKLGSMFDDPIVDKFLQETYNFNLVSRYGQVVIPQTIESVNSSGDSQFDLYRLTQALFYSQLSLQMDLIRDENTLQRWHELIELYQSNRPIAKAMGERIYHMANDIGFDTIGKQRRLFRRIVNTHSIDGHRLRDILSI
jgi:hypothetical protein